MGKIKGNEIVVRPATSGAVLSSSLEGLADTVRALAGEAKAENTRRAYRAAFSAFETWCSSLGVSAVPATAGTVVLYIGHLVELGRKASTITLALAAISDAHREHRLESPTSDVAVRRVMRGTRRVLGTAPTKKAPVRVEELRALVGTLDDSLTGLRDRALLVVGFAGAFRRSELVGLDVSDVVETKHGLLVTIRKSKTDQTGQGHEVALPYGSSPSTCPVRVLRDWLDAAGIKAGPLFRAVNRGGAVSEERLSDKTVARVVKEAAKRAGLDPAKFAGHSLRSGLITSAAEAGKPLDTIMKQSRHRSPAVALSYVQRADKFRHNAAGGIGL